jgi:hypothetical protein
MSCLGVTNISNSQSTEQIQKIYDFYTTDDVYRGVILDIEKIVEIHNDSLHNEVFRKLYKLLEKKPNDKVRAFILAVDNYYSAKKVNNLIRKFDDHSKLDEALKIALRLDDQLMLAYIYSYYGNTFYISSQPQGALFYFKKSSDILAQIQHSNLYLEESNLFDVAKILYQLFEFENCIFYGKKCLESSKKPASSFQAPQKVLIFDLIGAAYKGLENIDSSLLYYNCILSLLKEEPLDQEYHNELWTSIAQGNIGENLLNKGKISEARHYIEHYFNFQKEHDDAFNIALSRNLLARLYAETGREAEAKQLWKSVLDDPANKLQQRLIINAANGLTKFFAKSGSVDSALIYQKISMEQQASVQQIIYQSGLKAAENQIAFEKMENSLKYSNELINKIKLSRNLSILSLVLAILLVLVISFWNRSRWKFRLKEESLQKQMVAQQVQDSKHLLDNMTQSLIEKSEIVNVLSERLDQLEKSDAYIGLKEQISELAFTKEEDWQRFYAGFERVYPSFTGNLNQHVPNFFPAELRLAVMMKVGLSNTQIAGTLGISAGSVAKSKYRLKQKLELDSTQNLESFIQNL